MASTSLGEFRPLTVAQVRALLDDLPVPWWISGGHALELHVGASWRSHGDLDVSLRRTDAPALSSRLAGWELFVAAAGQLRRWDGAPLVATRHENNLWCRPGPDQPWAIDVTIGEGDDDVWVYRRDPRLRVRWRDAVLATSDGTRYLAPELQLLFKSRDPRPKDGEDAAQVIPRLDDRRRRRLGGWLPSSHPWQHLLGDV
jgi:hypothetical protein